MSGKTILLLKWFTFTVISGYILYLSWPNHNFPFIVFFGITALILTPKFVLDKSARGFLQLFFSAFFIRTSWVGANSIWLAESTPKSFYAFTVIDALVFAILLTPSLFALNRQLKFATLFFAASWMTFEFISQNFGLSQPFFSLGFVFGEYPILIQFYRFVGVEGGSLLILIIGLIIARVVEQTLVKETMKKSLFLYLGLAMLPYLLSPLLTSKSKNSKTIDVLAVHSYRETYNPKYHQKPELIVDQLWQESVKALQRHPNAQLLIWPETLISNLDWLSNPKESRAYKRILEKLQNHPELTLVTGGYGFTIDPNGAQNPYASFDTAHNRYFNGHNVALSLKSSGQSYIRSKEKFIPFQEQVPYLGALPSLSKLVDVVGSNTTTSYYSNGTDIHPLGSGINYTPILCYESVFSLFMSRKAQNNNLIVLLANEYWNPAISGSERYLAANSPIAIQSGIPIVRSSNSGISALIDADGMINKRKTGHDSSVLFGKIALKEESTIYEFIAGFIYYPSLIVCSILLLFYLTRKRQGSNTN